MAKIKAEFLQQWYKYHPPSLRARMIAHISTLNRLGMLFPQLFNAVVTHRISSRLLKKTLSFAPLRSIPTLNRITLRKWAGRHLDALNDSLPKSAPAVILFVDEFTNFNDTSLGITAIRLLNRLGIRILIEKHAESGRTYISKGFLKKARLLARTNVKQLGHKVSNSVPLVGIEPSAILSFRDEIPELVGDDLHADAMTLAENSYTIEEYIVAAYEEGRIDRSMFTDKRVHVKLHGHCQQKAVASTVPVKKMLAIPENYEVIEIPSGCCGMAGSFGYEKEHYDLSMKVGELVLFPAVRAVGKEELIAAPGTSCRHQIKDGTGITAYHPLEILYTALN
jgi:Fe-S oxidoreductase